MRGKRARAGRPGKSFKKTARPKSINMPKLASRGGIIL